MCTYSTENGGDRTSSSDVLLDREKEQGMLGGAGAACDNGSCAGGIGTLGDRGRTAALLGDRGRGGGDDKAGVRGRQAGRQAAL